MNLDEPFAPEMEKAVEVVKAAGWSGDVGVDAKVGDATREVAAAPTAVQKDWDAVVREMREGKRSE